jgi:hypothetical protein
LHQKLRYYIRNELINQDELDDIIKSGIVNKGLVDEVNKWLDLKEGEVNQVDFYEPELELEEEESDGGDLKGGQENTHFKIGELIPIKEKKIERPHLLVKSHSFNLDVRGREKNDKTFRDLIKTSEKQCMVDDLILYEETGT